MQETLLTFEQQWTDEGNGRALPTFVTEELARSCASSRTP